MPLGEPGGEHPRGLRRLSETEAAYRLLRGEGFDEQDLLKSHRQCTQQRMAEHRVVLCLQDTTELNFNGRQTEGLGPLSYEAQRGMYVHPTLAVTPEREPLGVLDAWIWAREPKAEDGTHPGVKESERWKEGYERVAELAPALPETRLVYVADREADILALMRRAQQLGNPADWLLRAQHNRALPQGRKLWEATRETEPLGEIRFTLPAGRGRKARQVQQQLHARRVTLSERQGGEAVEATCVIAREVSAPDQGKPIEWRLLTNGAVETLERALVLFLIISWRIDRLMRLGRNLPDLPAELLLETEDWQVAYVLNKQSLPQSPPRLNEAIRLVARFCGILGRKSDGERGNSNPLARPHAGHGLLRRLQAGQGSSGHPEEMCITVGVIRTSQCTNRTHLSNGKRKRTFWSRLRRIYRLNSILLHGCL